MNRSVGLSVGTFIHDEQKQFAKCLQLAYDVNKAYTSRKGNSPFALMIDLQEMNTFGGNFRTASSKTSFGLQILV